MRTPAPAVQTHHLQLLNVASHDWIKKDCIIKEVPGRLILDTANMVYPYESTDGFRDESHYSILFQQQGSMYNHCWHLCPTLPLCFAAALWCHRCEMKMNLHPKR